MLLQPPNTAKTGGFGGLGPFPNFPIFRFSFFSVFSVFFPFFFSFSYFRFFREVQESGPFCDVLFFLKKKEKNKFRRIRRRVVLGGLEHLCMALSFGKLQESCCLLRQQQTPRSTVSPEFFRKMLGFAADNSTIHSSHPGFFVVFETWVADLGKNNQKNTPK